MVSTKRICITQDRLLVLVKLCTGYSFSRHLPTPFPYPIFVSTLGNAKGLEDVGNTNGVLDGGDGTTGSVVEELVDLSDASAIHQHGNSHTDGLDGTGLSTLIEETKFELGEGDTEGVLELGTCQHVEVTG